MIPSAMPGERPGSLQYGKLKFPGRMSESWIFARLDVELGAIENPASKDRIGTRHNRRAPW
jgi:hypothetical protein